MTETELDELKNKWFHIGWEAALREVILCEDSTDYGGVEFARDWLKSQANEVGK
jgi:hypothetical protein